MISINFHRPEEILCEAQETEGVGIYPVVSITADSQDKEVAFFPKSIGFCRDAAAAFARAAEILEEGDDE